jgi:hypothetical protein
MVRHSAIVKRDGYRAGPRQLSFADNAWPRYVPIRMPDVTCVQERIPPGAAAVLIHRSHTYTDLYLPIDARQKRLFDAIDGKRTFGEIAREVVPIEADAARAFFERLGLMDQIVVDESRAVGAPQ